MYMVYIKAIKLLTQRYTYAWATNDLRAYQQDKKLARFITRRLTRYGRKVA